MNFPVFDLHCDTALALLEDTQIQSCGLRNNALHIDLERAGKYPGYVQCFACFTSPLQAQDPELTFLRELNTIQDQVQRNRDLIAFAGSAGEITKNRARGSMSAILTIEGPAGFQYDPSRLEHLYSLGFRMTTLGWNEQNPLVGSHITGGGLTELGIRYVQQAQKVGMLIDVSHISDQGFWDIMKITNAPIIASHSNSRSVYNVSRNLTDDMFRAICETGGVVGINMYADFLGDVPDLDTVCDHIFYFLSIDTGGQHIALGGDLDGCDRLPNGFDGIQDYDKLANQLIRRGLNENTIFNIFWNNALGVMEHAVCEHQK